jgi:hypothetical protein
MATDRATIYLLGDEQRALVQGFLKKEELSLARGHFEQLVGGIETSIESFLSASVGGTFREAHDSLRQLYELSHDDDQPVAQLRARIKTLPRRAIDFIDGRAPIVSRRLFRREPPITRFQEWAIDADRERLIRMTQVLSAQGGRWVKGRNRGAGKRSNARWEPEIMGENRGSGTRDHRGGAPTNGAELELIGFLAFDWQCATGNRPKPGRSDKTGFGDLVHSVFQWLCLPEGAATYALRRYWSALKMRKAPPILKDSAKPSGEEL